MGVKGLWRLLQPVARPIKLETLANRRLAVDASIWLHQFLRGMRDQEGNAIANAHILGFYRRICKLLYYNIKPVFVYDGGTPNLKRLTLAERRKRRRNDVNMLKRTAEKLLATQLRLRELEKKRIAKMQKNAAASADSGLEIVHDSTDNPNYLDALTGLPMDAEAKITERSAALVRSATGGSQAKLAKDRYFLPPMDNDFDTLAQMRQNDLRFGVQPEDIEHDDIQKFINDFKKEGGLDNIDSDVFKSLPSELQYEILSDIRARSRVTSYDRVQEMVRLSNTPLDFSKLQVEGVIRRNTVTQKLLTVNQAVSKMDEATALSKPGRIASQRNREYILVRNEEGGWVLGGKATAGATKDKPLKVDDSDDETAIKAEPLSQVQEASDEDEDVEFEEVKVKPEGTPVPAVTTAVAASATKLEHQHSLVDDFEAYADEDESIEQVMAKFAELEEEEVRDLSKRRDNSPIAGLNGANRLADNAVRSVTTPRKTLIMTDMDDGDVESTTGASPFSRDESLDFGDFDGTLDDTLNDEVSMLVPNLHDSRPQHGIVISDTHDVAPKKHAHRSRALSVTEENQLDQESFFTYWTAYIPENFKERHPTHDTMVREAVFVWDNEQLELEKHSAERKLEKMSVNDIIGVECQRFWVDFLTSLEHWRKMNDLHEATAAAPAAEGAEESSNEPSIQMDEVTASHMSKSEEQVTETTLIAPAKPFTDIGFLDFSSSVLRRTQPAVELPVMSAPPSSMIEDTQLAATVDVISNDSGVGSLATSPEPDQVEEVSLPTGEAKEESAMEIDQEKMAAISLITDQQPMPAAHDVFDEEIVIKDGGEAAAAAAAEDDDDDDLDEAHAVDLENEEQDFTQLFPDMASLPGVTVIPKSEPTPEEAEVQQEQEILTQEERAALEQQEDEANLAEARRLQEEIKNLSEQKRRHNRDADDLTEQMVAETQLLLRLFGIPYIVAPMEAEAQCADLQQRGVVEGILTEDSDVFLFGGKRIFKNMFREERFVECYLMSDIERDLGVTRERLIQLAHLLGSDYTNGIKGVGVITAMEILRLFPSLKKFAKWWRGGHRLHPEHEGEEDKDEEGAQNRMTEDESEDDDGDVSPKDEVALEKLARLCQKLYVPNSFPSNEVSGAYLHPMVDDSDGGPRGFEWGIPDLDGLRDFLRQSMSWDRGEVDRVLLPIIRQMSRASMEGAQTTLDNFFDHSGGMDTFLGPRRNLQMSARLRKVVSGLTGGNNVTEEDEESSTKHTSRGANKKTNKRSATTAGRGKKNTTSGRANGKRTHSGASNPTGQDGPTSDSSEGEQQKDNDKDVEETEEAVTHGTPPKNTGTQKKRRKTNASSSPAAGSIKGRKPTVVGRKQKEGASASVQAAKRNLASKDVEFKLAERRRKLAETAAAEPQQEVEVAEPVHPTKRPLAPEDYSTASESSSGEDEDFVQDHWDRLNHSHEPATTGQRPKLTNKATPRRGGSKVRGRSSSRK